MIRQVPSLNTPIVYGKNCECRMNAIDTIFGEQKPQFRLKYGLTSGRNPRPVAQSIFNQRQQWSGTCRWHLFDEWLLAWTGRSFVAIFDTSKDRSWHPDELHFAKLLAVKRPVMTGRIWPRQARHTTSKSTSAIGKRIMINDSYPETLASAADLHRT